MLKWLALLGLVAILQAPVVWYVDGLDGTLRLADVECHHDPRWTHVELRRGENGFSAFVVNPDRDWSFHLWGGHEELETYRFRWDDRLVLVERASIVAEWDEAYEGTEVLPGGEVKWHDIELPADAAGRHLVVYRVDGLCGMAELVIS